MRYVITAHGCHRTVEIVPLFNVRLLMYAHENEYVKYDPPYIGTFCEKGYRKKKKAYKPLFGVSDSYYEMEFGKEEGDSFHSYIECCTTHEPIYDFANGDLLLSDVIELVTHHARMNEYYGQISLSVLTCNTPCHGSVPDVGTALHRSTSYELDLEPPNYNWNTTRRNTRTKRKLNMTQLPQSQRVRVHYPKTGNLMVHRETGEKTRVTKQNRKTLKRTHYFIPELNYGDVVYYYGETYVIYQVAEENTITYYQIRNTRTGEMYWVDAREVLKIEY